MKKESSLTLTFKVAGSNIYKYTHTHTIFADDDHRDKTSVQMPAKIFPDLKLLCWLFIGPTLGFDTKPRNSFLIKFGVFLR
jgi:hypothetical protein